MGECELSVTSKEVNCNAPALEKRMRFEIPHKIFGLWNMAASIGASCTP
jgi:hypothetical protein